MHLPFLIRKVNLLECWILSYLLNEEKIGIASCRYCQTYLPLHNTKLATYLRLVLIPLSLILSQRISVNVCCLYMTHHIKIPRVGVLGFGLGWGVRLTLQNPYPCLGVKFSARF